MVVEKTRILEIRSDRQRDFTVNLGFIFLRKPMLYLTRYKSTCLGGIYTVGSFFKSSSNCRACNRRSADREVNKLALAKFSAISNDSRMLLNS